jgi:hypothetical protein
LKNSFALCEVSFTCCVPIAVCSHMLCVDPNSVIGSLNGALSVNVAANGVVVVTFNGQQANFNLQNKVTKRPAVLTPVVVLTTVFSYYQADLKLFAELQYVLSTPSLLAHQPLSGLVNDKVPDFFSFALSGVKVNAFLLAFVFTVWQGVGKAFGRDSVQFKAALHLVDALIPVVCPCSAPFFPLSFSECCMFP